MGGCLVCCAHCLQPARVSQSWNRTTCKGLSSATGRALGRLLRPLAFLCRCGIEPLFLPPLSVTFQNRGAPLAPG